MKDRTVLQAKRLGVLRCQPQDRLRAVVRRMADDDISALVVVDDDGLLVGIISRSDILRAGVEEPDWPNATVSRFMTRDVISVTPDTKLAEVMRILLRNHIHRVVVVREDDQGRKQPIAVLSDSDLVCDMADVMG